MTDFKFDCGDEVKDIVTGFQGIIMARSDHITGCNRYGVQPQEVKDSRIPEADWFDETRVVLVQAAKIPRLTSAERFKETLTSQPPAPAPERPGGDPKLIPTEDKDQKWPTALDPTPRT